MNPWIRPLQPKGGKAAHPENFAPFNAPGEEGQGDVLPLFPGHGGNGRRSLPWIPRASVPVSPLREEAPPDGLSCPAEGIRETGTGLEWDEIAATELGTNGNYLPKAWPAEPSEASGRRGWSEGTRLPAIGLALLFTSILALGGFFFYSLQETRTQLQRTEERIQATEARNHLSEQRVRRAEEQFRTARSDLEGAISRLEARQTFTASQMDAKLQREFEGLRQETQRRLSDLMLQGTREEQRREQEALTRLDAFQRDFSARLYGDYDQLKQRHERLFNDLTSRANSARSNEEVFREAFYHARKATVFIRTEYLVRDERTGTTEKITGFGTGFLVSPEGLGVTAQHVVFPWRYDPRLILSENLGLVRVLEESLRITMWLTDRRVVDSSRQPPRFFPENGYRFAPDHDQVRILFVGKPELQTTHVPSPFGPYPIKTPKLGSSDLAVFQIRDVGRRFPTVELSTATPEAAPLDHVMVVGYPLSRLPEGLANPQPSVGRVRRVTKDNLELDSPLHPGNSGGPVLDRQGRVIGLASAILDSPVYGLAVRAEAIRKAIEQVRADLRAEQQRLTAMGCYHGPIDGIAGRQTWRARRCAEVSPGDAPSTELRPATR